MTIEALPDFSLAGRRALVTGSTRGIGHAIARAFAAAGASVCVHGVEDGATLETARAAVSADALAVRGDIADDAERDAMLAEIWPALDILVLNAAVQINARWDAIDDDAFRRQIDANLRGPYRLIRHFVPGMVARGHGRVIAIGSVQETKEHPDMLVYAATKSAQTNMVRNLARQLARSGVTANVLSPGAIETERNRTALADPAYREIVRAKIPAARFGTPGDCAGAAVFLASSAASYVTGISLPVDGGMHL